MISGVTLSPLKIIPVESGNVFHALKQTDQEFKGFGEAYFSTVKKGHIKAWKRHQKMTLNLVVPVGEIQFVLYDDRQHSSTRHQFYSVNLSLSNYQRLTIPPMVWMGFQGVGEILNLLLNVADIPHDPEEVNRCELHTFMFSWNDKENE
ncbi:MAG: dTDP-4-dehydrorhamnose 3,5-epimerase family protein [Desulfamplus sp.]|nr:dTDP-4-dehydrorhamnose 3,5-epimerase family protein [Desulfamplus sp.]